MRVSGGAAEFDVVVSRLAAGLGGQVAVLDPAEGFGGASEGRAGPARCSRSGLRSRQPRRGERRLRTRRRTRAARPRASDERRGSFVRGRPCSASRASRVWVAAVSRCSPRSWSPASSSRGSRVRGGPGVAPPRTGEAARWRRTARGSPHFRLTVLGWRHARPPAALESERYRWPKLMSAAPRASPVHVARVARAGSRSRRRAAAVPRARGRTGQAEVSRFEHVLSRQPGAEGVVMEGPTALSSGRSAGRFGSRGPSSQAPTSPGGRCGVSPVSTPTLSRLPAPPRP